MTTADKQPQNSGRDGQGRFATGNPHAFQKGQSGNPKGRPKSITLSEAYRKKLAEVDPDDQQGRTFAEVLAEQTVLKAKGGDVAALRELADRAEGKPRQSMTLTIDQREKFERAVDGMLAEAVRDGVELTRAEAVAALAVLRPEASELIH